MICNGYQLMVNKHGIVNEVNPEPETIASIVRITICHGWDSNCSSVVANEDKKKEKKEKKVCSDGPLS